jgi:hypothetical protein
MSKLTIEIGAKLTQLQAGLRSANGLIRNFSKSVGGALSSVGGMIGMSLGGAGIAAFVKSVVSAGDQIADGAKRIGVTAEAYQKLSRAAELTGTSIETVESSFKTMNDTIDAAGQGSAQANTALGRIGLTFAQLKNMGAEERFRTIATALGEVANAGERAALITDIFGRGSQALKPMIADYDNLAAGAATMSDEAVKAADELTDAIVRT